MRLQAKCILVIVVVAFVGADFAASTPWNRALFNMVRRVVVKKIFDDVIEKPKWGQNLNTLLDLADPVVIKHVVGYWGTSETTGTASSRTFAQNWRHINDCDVCRPVFTRLAEGTRIEQVSCMNFVFDLDAGTMNGISASSDHNSIIARFPCFDDLIVHEQIRYDTFGFWFDTERDFLWVTKEFAGSTSEEVFGLNRLDLYRNFGEPSEARGRTQCYRSSYGGLRVILGEDETVETLVATPYFHKC